MKHLIVYQIKYKKVIVSSFLTFNILVTTAINVKRKTRLYFMKDSYFVYKLV